ncbi:HAMP domain-containing histidine kinase [Streptomyces sp. N2-109]|uniref:histidine kinase n=2 Tax=Streptomyces gossypii TaxID=2883101 RepID=A0ABT2JZK3_9ACTN|nr:HAMP domain-containing sensor histidine kinase [Streptomyces gossypii]MCT2592819.1 HAMP domain-containing histidine kinase [Streptomyces gossypii]
MTLRSRLALLVAVTVAVAVAACATVAWFLVRAQLVSSLDDALRESQVSDAMVIRQWEAGQCRSVPEATRRAVPNPFDSTVQLVDRSGNSCMAFGEQPLPVGGQDAAVARGERTETLHTVRASDGVEYRVLTRPLRVPGADAAVSVARPLDEVDHSLDTLALVLGLVAAAGVLGAAGAGVALARAGLRPVVRLTGAVEHVARTEDLAVQIPVEGDDEIARLSRSFNSMTASLASSRALQQQLIADAGHELRTPLTSMRTNIDLLVRSEETGRALPPEDRAELLASVRAQMAELAALIGDLQELSRPEGAGAAGAVAGGPNAPVPVVALHTVTERAVERARLRRSGVALTARLAPWYVRADPASLERAVLNLLDNAVKFSPAGGTVTVSLDGGTLRIRDHGPGVPAEELPYVFDRFWRSPSARSMPGSGLGLSIVARTVRQAGGHVELRPAGAGAGAGAGDSRGDSGDEGAGGGGTEAVLRLPGAAAPPPDTGWPTTPLT